MEVGASVDPRHGFKAEDIAAPGVTWVRTVLLPPPDDLRTWILDCHAHGLKVLGVVARESLLRGWTYRAAVRHYARRYPDVDAWQIGNESDHRSASSWTLPQRKLNRLLESARRELGPGALVVGPGLVSGQPAYLDAVSTGMVDAIAVHPYGRGPSPAWPYYFGPVEDLVALYQRFGKPLWVTEFGGPGGDFADEHERARYHSEMLLALEGAGVEVAMVFCWSDAMVPGFGLIDANGNAKESYAAFFAGARAVHDSRIVNREPPIPSTFHDYRGQLPATGAYSTRAVDGIIGATIHYTATPASLTVEQIAAGQLSRDAAPGGPKFPAIAYTLVIPEDGSVALCHDLGVRTWHSAAPGRNDHYVGIAYIGDHEPNPAQLVGLGAALRWVEDQLGRGLQVIEGHKDGLATACPGPTWPAWRAQVLP